MVTNDEIQKKVGINYGYFDCEWELEGLKEEINKMQNMARADEREKVIAELSGKVNKNIFTPKTTAEIIRLLKNPKSQITMTTETLQDILNDESNRTRNEVLKTTFEVTIKKLDIMLEEMEKRANFFYKDATDLANKNYERGFFDGIHNARAKIKEILEKRD